MVLRPDITTPIARIAATKMPESAFPAKLFYTQKSYRAGMPGSGHSTEVMQGGIELLGCGGLNSDIELVVMAVDALRECTDKKIHIEIGNAGFFKHLASELGIEGSEFEQMRSMVENKNFAGLNDMLDAYEDTHAKLALCKLSRLFGGVEVLDIAQEYASDSKAKEDIEYLRSLYTALCQAGVGDCVSIDLGLVHQIDYYTGVIIRGYVDGVGRPVLSGGRYDKLTGMFGRDMPAVGFAIDIDAVASLVNEKSDDAKTVLYAMPGAIRNAFDYMDKNPGCLLSSEETLDKAIEKFSVVTVIYPDGKTEICKK